MTDRPRLSVVVPFYNSERTLQACIESLLAQEFSGGSTEIILIDNRSTDASSSIASEYPELIVLNEQTPGAYAARNAGIRQASAPLIAFTDADCVVDPDWVGSIVDGMQAPETAMLIGHCRYPTEASLALRWLAAYENAKTDYVTHHCDPAHHFTYCNNMAVRASIFADLGLFEQWQRAGDSELAHRMAARRPDLKLAYRPSMRITHLEFVTFRERAKRLHLYTETNSQIATFQELGFLQRLAVLRHLIRNLKARRPSVTSVASRRP